MASLMLPPPGTRSRVLRHLQHMEPLKKRKGGKFAKQMPYNNQTFVQPRDRIAYWNIGPGDEVRVRVGGVYDEKTKKRLPYEGIVETVDRERNLAWLRAPEGGDEARIPRNKKTLEPRFVQPEPNREGGYGPNMAYVARPVHYSNLQLKLPEDLVLPEDVKLDLKAGVFASRLSRSAVTYSRNLGHFVWRRTAHVKTPEGVLEIEVPWKKTTARNVPRKDNTTLSYVVDNETWLPWSPEAPTWLFPPRKYTSPHALERHQRSLAQRTLALRENGAGPGGKMSLASAAARAAERAAAEVALPIDSMQNAAAEKESEDEITAWGAEFESASQTLNASMLPGSSSSSRLPTYSGFAKQLLRKAKMPLLPQPPSPAEQLWMAKYDMQQWRAECAEVIAAVKEEGRAEEIAQPQFTAFDYLDAAPIDGPTSSFASAQTKETLDSWPIELMMKDDLMNEQGAKHRRLRWQSQQIEKAMRADEAVAEEKETVRMFKAMKLKPTATVTQKDVQSAAAVRRANAGGKLEKKADEDIAQFVADKEAQAEAVAELEAELDAEAEAEAEVAKVDAEADAVAEAKKST